MKKIILSLTLIATGFWAQSQAVVSGVSPASIQGNYEFGIQANCGAWPGQTDDGTWDVLSNLDFNVNGTFVQAELMLVEDGTPGVNPQGNPISQEGCNTLTNDLTGKIAVIYRNTCEFGVKVLNAQNAGAVAAIIVNNVDDAALGMLGGVNGVNVTIPAVILSSVDGSTLVNEMDNGPVEMFIGNKYTTHNNDLGAVKGEYLISKYGTHSSLLNNNFDLGIQIYNYGVNDQNGATVNATITGPSGVVYDETVNLPSMSTTDTVAVFNGNPEAFPTFDLGIGNYPAGDYTLVYTIDLGVTDEDPFDNVFTSTFSIGEYLISYARVDGSGLPMVTTFPSNTEDEYKSCMFFEDPNASNLTVSDIYFAPYTDTTVNDLASAEIFITFYEWNDTWIDINDPSITANDQYFQNLNAIGFEVYYPTSNSENGLITSVSLTTPLILDDSQRYLVCAETFDPVFSFGYDGGVNYNANIDISAMPTCPIQTNPLPTDAADTPLTWFIAGWTSSAGSSIGLELVGSSLGLSDEATVSGNAFPNPASDVVTVSVDATGDGNLVITDISGKVVMNESVTLVSGRTTVDLSNLENGLYIFNMTLDNGKTSRFNVVKK